MSEPALGGTEEFDRIVELFAGFGPIKIRRLFGGAGLYVDGLMFALVDDGVIYFKVDETTIPAFERERLGPFTYKTKAGTNTIRSYWRMPERLYDDPDELARWAMQALETARRKSSRKLARRTLGKSRRKT